MKTLHKR